MRKLYEKNELVFALAWIAVYVAGTGLAETLDGAFGTSRTMTAVFHLGMTAGLLIWVRKNGMTEKYGLLLPRYPLAQALFFVPLILLCASKLVFSPALRFGAAETVLYVLSMLCVGFLEELIFRGFLFRAIERENLTRAIVISSVAFGIGHIVNLMNGQNVTETVGQILFAMLAGFTLAVLFYKGKSLIPCIVFHGVYNALSAVANDEAMNRALGGPVPAMIILMAVSAALLGGYALWNWKHLKG